MLSSRAPPRPVSPFWPESTPTRGRIESRLERPPSRSSRTHSTSVHSERRPMGPRSPSPLPIQNPELLEKDVENTLSQMAQGDPSTPARKSSKASSMSTVQQSRRPPLEARVNEATPRGVAEPAYLVTNAVEPLFIKKKASLRSNDSPPHKRHSQIPTRAVSTRRTSPQAHTVKRTLSLQESSNPDTSDQILTIARTTREDVCRIFLLWEFTNINRSNRLDVQSSGLNLMSHR